MRTRLPLWIPDGEEGWILSFPNGLSICYLEDTLEHPATVYDVYLDVYERPYRKTDAQNPP